MARQSGNPVVASETVQIPLLPDQVTQLLTLKITLEEMVLKLMQECQNGYSFSCTWNDDRKEYSARLAGVDAKCPNARKLLYGNAKTERNAILALYAKHFLVAEGGQWVSTTPISSEMS